MGPFLRSKNSTNKIMLHLLVALLPIIIFIVYKNGYIPYSHGLISFIEMSNISKNSGTNVGIELSSIAVTGESGGRGECWKFNISNQFPIIPPNIENGKVVWSNS